MYNAEIKSRYMKQHKRGTQKNLQRVFKITQPFESDLNKDIFSFTREELRRLFYTFMATTSSASKQSVQYVSGYIEWAIDEGLCAGTNPLESVDTKWKEQFVIVPEKRYWTDVEIHAMLKEIVSAQVAVVFYAPFVGIRGNDNAEIVNIKKNDIDADNLTVRLVDADNSVRIITVDHEFIRLCQQAIKEEEYLKSNGSPDVDIKAPTASLIENDFVVRSVDIKVKNTQEADGMIVYRRFNTVSTFFNEPNLNPTLVLYSGMLAMAKNLLLDGKLDDDGYKAIAKQFNLNDYSLKRVRDDFLNEQTVKELYDLS